MIIYCFSGLGADKRVFKHLKLDANLIHVDWIEPFENESIKSYSKRLSLKIPEDGKNFGILGVSFGGLIATEISKILKPKITILISSAETKYELRKSYRFIAKINFLRWIPVKLFDIPRFLAYWVFGTKEKRFLNDILNDTNLNFVKWAIIALTKWNNVNNLKNRVLKLSGEKDKLIPPNKCNNQIIIQNGQHLMIVDKAEEISSLINNELKSL